MLSSLVGETSSQFCTCSRNSMSYTLRKRPAASVASLADPLYIFITLNATADFLILGQTGIH